MYKVNNKIDPLYLSVLLVIFIAATHCYSIYELNQQNITGLSVSYDYQKKSLVIDGVDHPDGSVAPIPNGTLLLSLTGKKDTVELTENVTMWAQANKNHQELKKYFSEHRRIYDVLQEKVIIANIGRYDEFEIVTRKPVGLGYLPLEFWVVRLVNIMALLIGIAVWIYKPKTSESFYIVAAGVSYYIFGLLYSVIEGSELTISPASLSFSFIIQTLSLNVFAFCFFFLLLQYPSKVFGGKIRFLFVVFFILVTLSNLRFIIDIPFHSYFFQFVVYYLASIFIAFRQWHVNVGNPINKAATVALQLSLLLPSFLIILLYFLPEIYNEPPVINQFIGHVLLSFIFVGWAISILKFKLFEVERWWFKSWLLIISTLLIVCLDFILLYLFNFSKELTTAWTIIIIGFVYFPIRQFLLSRTSSFDEPPLKESVIAYVEKTKESESLQHYDEKWLELLSGTFHAMEREKGSGCIHAEKIDGNGLHLLVRSLFEDNHYKLSGKHRGNRLFNQKDVKYCRILFETIESIAQSNLDKQKIRLLERKRIMHDLHDNLGAMLLTMTYTSTSDSDKEKAKGALSLLRDTVYYSGNSHDIDIIDLVDRCRSELKERLIGKKTTHSWELGNNFFDGFMLSSEKSLAISYMLREACTNAIKHADPDYIDVSFSLQGGYIFVRIKNNDNTLKKWQSGFGINSIKRRCKSMMAEPRWDNSQGVITLELKIPV